jgi:WD40 repeat protein
MPVQLFRSSAGSSVIIHNISEDERNCITQKLHGTYSDTRMSSQIKNNLAALFTLFVTLFATPPTFSQQPELAAQTNHSMWIQTVTFSPDGRLVATGGGDGTIKLWDVASGRQLRTIFGHPGTKPFEPEEKQNLTESKDWVVDLFETTHGHRAVYSLAFSPNGKTLASGSTDRTIKLWEVATGNMRGAITQAVRVWFVVFNQDGTKLLSIGADGSYRYWDVATQTEIKDNPPPLTSFRLPWTSPNGKLTVSYSEKETTIKIVDLVTNRQRVLEGHSAGVRRAVFSPDGEMLASCGWDKTVRLWDLKGEHAPKVLTGHTAIVSSIAFTPDGRRLASVGGDLTVKLWDVESGRELKTLRGYSDAQIPLAFGKDDKILITASGNTIHVWNIAVGKEVAAFRAQNGFVNKAVFSPDKNILATADVQDIDLWETGKWNPKLIKTLPDKQGALVAQLNPSNIIRLWDIDNLQLLRELRGHNGKGITALAYSEDGKMLASAGVGLGSDSTVRIWNLVNDKAPILLTTGTGIISVLAFSPDKRILAGGDFLGAIKLWDATSGQEFKPLLIKHTGEIFLLGFSKDGKTLVSFSKDNSVKVWDVQTAQLKDSVRFDTGGWAERVYKYAPDFIGNLPLLTKSNSKFTILIDANGRVEFHDAQSNKLLAWLIALRQDDWAVVTPDGRFDTNQLEKSMGLSWISPDVPLTPLPLDIFMRDYYEPRLLPRILAGQKFPELLSLAELNRNQPEVKKVTVVPQVNHPDLVTVKVEVASVSGQCLKDGKHISCESGVYDLRLYRDGQLVGQSPAPTTAPSANGGKQNREEQMLHWRKTSVVKVAGQSITIATGSREVVFTNIRLPRRADITKVEFTAYAFNKDRVRSASSEPVSFNLPIQRPAARRRAYVITVGVDATSDPSLRLSFAPNGAREIEHLLREKLKSQYEVISVPLISEYKKGSPDLEQDRATKNNIQAVLNLLSSKGGTTAQRQAFPMLKQATPDDLVVLYIASHGYADPNGKFYVVPSDVGEPAGVSDELLDRCLKNLEQSKGCQAAQDFLHHNISSEELTPWLQPIDAGQIALILDSCHSGAVSGPNFKPGPMGDRGFGQLSYDKGMLVLAATQAENLAWGTLELGDRSLLTDALINQEGQDEKQPFDLKQWLSRAKKQAPDLYRKYVSQGMQQEQEPELFDFARWHTAVNNN